MAGAGSGAAKSAAQMKIDREKEGAAGFKELASAAMNAFTGVTKLGGAITQQLLGPLESVRSLVSSIGQMVSLANPAIMQNFMLALNDTAAVIGRMLIPVMQSITVFTRAYGDALAKLAPALEPLFEAIANFIAGYATAVIPLVEAAAPFIALWADALVYLLKALSQGIAFFQGVVIELLNTFSSLFGLEKRFNMDASSRGAAVRQISVGGIEQTASAVFAKAAQNAFAQAGQEPKKQEDWLKDIATAIKSGQQVVKDIYAEVVKIVLWTDKQLNKANDAGNAIGDFANAPVGQIGGFGKLVLELGRIMGR